MQIIIQSPGFKASEALETFVNEKVGKLGNHSAKIIRADVTLFKGAEAEQQNKYCEIRLEVPGYDHYVKKNCDSFEQAAAEAVDSLKHMLEKSKDKEIAERHSH